MNAKDIFSGIAFWKKTEPTTTNKTVVNDPRAVSRQGGQWGQAYSLPYNGEKDLGEMGPAVNYWLDYDNLRTRSWQAYLDSDIAHTVLNKMTLWMIDEGLKLQANPMDELLETEGFSMDAEKFNDNVEARFKLWAESSFSSHDEMSNLNSLSKEAYKNAKIGGDVLVVLRLKDGDVNVQVIDAAHVKNPFVIPAKSKGNKIKHGIEKNKKGKHIAYHVQTDTFDFERILATNPQSGLEVAFLVYGGRFRIDNDRGMPAISTSLETLSKIDRYKEAAVGSAEERQKIAFAIEHEQFSTGESPLVGTLASAFDAGNSTTSDLPVDELGNQLANTISTTSNKNTYNMPLGSHLKSLESKNELYFKEFYSTNADIFCATMNIPPNVAFSLYHDSFSASRTATKDWEHTMIVERKDFSFQFYCKIYVFWLHIEILKQKVQAPGYLNAVSSKNRVVLQAYRNARFTGAMFPHIDPEKEVRAERLKLGATGADINLTTAERSTEVLNSGDLKSNQEQYAKELDRSKSLGIKTEDVAVTEVLDS